MNTISNSFLSYSGVQFYHFIGSVGFKLEMNGALIFVFGGLMKDEGGSLLMDDILGNFGGSFFYY